jgi:hypothetical protein
MLYERIEELRQTPQDDAGMAIYKHRLPLFGRVSSTTTNYVMDAVDRNTGQKYEGIDAYSLLYEAGLTFDVTNPNHLDLRIVRLYVDVIKFIDADITDVRWGDLGGGMRVREFSCEIEPRVGNYECLQASDDFDYIRLSSGEMETFCININVITEGIYRLRLGMEYSIGGQTKRVEVDSEIIEIGIFDPVFHKPSYTDQIEVG